MSCSCHGSGHVSCNVVVMLFCSGHESGHVSCKVVVMLFCNGHESESFCSGHESERFCLFASRARYHSPIYYILSRVAA